MEIKEGLTFDDVLLKPKRSSVVSRKDIDLRTKISRNITLNVPIISEDMDTVTESRMAITMARAGGLGIIHRFLPIERQMDEVLKVKRAENYTIEDPFTIAPDSTLKAAKEMMQRLDSQAFLVTSPDGKLLGIFTKRDFLFESDDNKKIGELMTPREKLIVAGPGTSLEEAQEFFRRHKIEKLPLVDAEDRLRGLITARDITHRVNPLAVRDKKGRLLVGAAVGIRGDYLERAEGLIKAGADLLLVDVAHGHLEVCLAATKLLKKKFPGVDLMAGNIATAEGARDLIQAGADSVRVGVGNGTICITRVQTGAGVPQITAILDARKGAGPPAGGVPIIASGGMRNSGDLVKALAAGASAGTFGSLLAGTDESPGEIVLWNNRRSKLYRGMASLGAHLERKKAERSQANGEVLADFVAEGADQVTVPYRGSALEVIAQLVGGLRSGMSYCGARTIPELWDRAEFIRMSDAGRKESSVHDVDL